MYVKVFARRLINVSPQSQSHLLFLLFSSFCSVPTLAIFPLMFHFSSNYSEPIQLFPLYFSPSNPIRQACSSHCNLDLTLGRRQCCLKFRLKFRLNPTALPLCTSNIFSLKCAIFIFVPIHLHKCSLKLHV